jgi:o-succinylbenzoate---CoA ligase
VLLTRQTALGPGLINLTTVSSRPLHAVLLPSAAGAPRFLAALAAALDGTGPALLPLDPALPPARVQELLAAFGPGTLETPAGTAPYTGGTAAGGTGVPPEVAVVVTTSGSTGHPKGVALSAAALRASAAASLDRIGARPGERWLLGLPWHHVAGLQVLVRSLLAGSEPVAAATLDAAAVAAAPGAHVSLVPTQLRRLLEAGAALDRLGTVLLGGAAPAAALVAAATAAGARVAVTYGMSETCGGCVYDGLPLDGVRVRVDESGLIGIAGPVLFSGYWPDAGLPAGRLGTRPGVPPDGWFATSDLGRLDADGRLTVRGRADDVINTGGEKVVPAEVEAVLGTIDGVRDVVVLGVPDPEWGEAVTAFVVPADPGAPPGLAGLRDAVRGRLGPYAAPRRLALLPAMPMLASGKPDRQTLRRQARKIGQQ